MIKMARQDGEEPVCKHGASAPLALDVSQVEGDEQFSPVNPVGNVNDFARFVFKCLYHTNCAVELAQ
jgi:hypothetical protein